MRAKGVCLPPALGAALSSRLGPGLAAGDESLGLLAAHGDLVYAWSRREAALLVADRGAGIVRAVTLAASPRHGVQTVTLNRAGTWAAVWGREGVTAVPLPRSSRREEVVVQGLALAAGEVQGLAWHPGSAADSHLTVLTRDARLALYNVTAGSVEVRGLALGAGGPVAAALGEVPVALAFGGPGAAGQWPLFVLFANCEVYCVAAALGQEWGVEGPLAVSGGEEGLGEGCSLLVVGGVLCLATVGGLVYHSVMLGGAATSLQTYEVVELELGQVASGAGDSVFECPVRLVEEVGGGGYLASHRAGLHRVGLPMVGLLLEDSPDLARAASTVEHLVCTRAAASLPPAPVLGACSARPPATVLALLADHTVRALPSSAPPPALPPLTTSPSSSPPCPSSTLHSKLLSILARSSTQPLLHSAAGAEQRLRPAEALELLTGATGTLRREYLARLHVAREELAAAGARLAARRRGQETSLAGLEEERGRLRAAAEGLSERHEDVRDRGTELRGRVEAVLARIEARAPQLSDKELGMAREVTGLERRVEALGGGVRQLGEKERYQRCQVEATISNKREVGEEKLATFTEVLQADSRSIAELVQQVNMAKKELGL